MKTSHLDSMEPIRIDCPFVLTDLKAIYYYQLQEQNNLEGETHTNWEFVCVNSGNYSVFEETNEFLLRQSQGLLHPPNCFHKEIANQKNATMCVIGFHAECKDLHTIASQVLTLNEEQKSLLSDIFSLACETFQPQDMPSETTQVYGAQQIIKNKIELLFLSLLGNSRRECSNKPTQNTRQKKRELVKEIKLLLSAELDAPFDLEKVANALTYSPNYLCRIFKKATGETMLQYYYRLKINKAQNMILETSMSLKEISDSLGFDTVQYFSAVFKKYAGVAPSQYKNAVIK